MQQSADGPVSGRLVAITYSLRYGTVLEGSWAH